MSHAQTTADAALTANVLFRGCDQRDSECVDRGNLQVRFEQRKGMEIVSDQVIVRKGCVEHDLNGGEGPATSELFLLHVDWKE